MSIYTLALESSCDETSASVLKDGRTVLSNVISSQVPIHRKFGGVVPEIASRHHIEQVIPVIDLSLIHIYYDSNFNRIRSYKIDANHTNLNNNGAYATNGNTLFTTLTTFVYVDEEGVVKNISPYASGMEVEDMDCRNGQMYMAVNRKGKVEIYSLSSLPFSVNV